ncbi:serum response factor-like isoform X1 [Solea solea]|uniref:serum response factor-like isoform X1 n=1 Tax=Solea solea TaxID=90069 RepID=UPI00272B39B6|nr:serum response factor-like isoform X1 [Solea solea]
MGTRTGSGRAGNGTGLNSLAVNTPGPNSGSDGAQFDDRGYGIEVVYSGSDQDSESGDEEDPASSGGDRRGVKRERSDGKAGHQAASGGVPGARPGKKTRGRVKIKMEFIDNKLRRYTTFSKRKTGIMKKAYELSTLTGTQVLLLVASETGHVYTFATRKLQPMITSETGKALIQTCLNSPDSPPRSDPSSDQRMSATGFEETDLTYQVSEMDGCSDVAKDPMKPAHALSTQAPPSSSVQTSAPSWQPQSSSNGSVIKTSAGVVLPGGFTLMPGMSLPPGTHTIPLSQLQTPPLTIQGHASTLHAPPTSSTTLLRFPATVSLAGGAVSQQLQTVQVQTSSKASTNQSGSDIHSHTSSTVAGHMMYPGGHTVMYTAPASSLGDGSLAVLNTFTPTGHAQSHDPGAVPQVFLTSLPPVATQIPVSAVQLHQMVISQQSSSNNLTELQVVSLDVHQSKDD